MYRRNTRCAVCGQRGTRDDPLTRGHIIPRTRGGPDEAWNIRPEHESCNKARGITYTRADAAEAAARRHG